MSGVLYLKHADDLSDEVVRAGWLENPYHQFFTGEVFFQTRLPCDPSSRVHWRQRLGEAEMEEPRAQTINAARAMTAVDARELSPVIVDSTVQEKAIAHPTNSRLLMVARRKVSHAEPPRRSKAAPELSAPGTPRAGSACACPRTWRRKSQLRHRNPLSRAQAVSYIWAGLFSPPP